jgi:hypothetical protein
MHRISRPVMRMARVASLTQLSLARFASTSPLQASPAMDSLPSPAASPVMSHAGSPAASPLSAAPRAEFPSAPVAPHDDMGEHPDPLVSPVLAAAAAAPGGGGYDAIPNVFTGRISKVGGAQIRLLVSIGFGVWENEKLIVEDGAKLQAFADRMRRDPEELSRWPKKLQGTLGRVILNPEFADVPKAVADLMRHMDASHLVSRHAINAIGAASGDDAITAAVTLTDDQKSLIELVKRGYNTYVGGTAGTGKSVLLRELRRTLVNMGLGVGMTATTGLAAANLKGCTFHHLFGVTKYEEFYKLGTTKALDVLIIDEISMMTRDMFERFDQALRRELNSQLPFGGLQIIVCGDFLQLEPVSKDTSPNRFIFSSTLFRENFVLAKLVDQVRQADDPAFARGLDQLRAGVWTDEMDGLIRRVEQSAVVAPGTMRLLPRNAEVQAANEAKLAALPGDSVACYAMPQVPTLSGAWTESLVLKVTPAFNRDAFANQCFCFLSHLVPVSSNAMSCYRLFNDAVVLRVRLPPQQELADAMVAAFAGLQQAVATSPQFQAPRVAARVVESHKQGSHLHTPAVAEALQRTLAEHPIAQPQQLKVGAEVMLRVNLTDDLVNGATGTIVDFVPAAAEHLSTFLRGKNNAHVEGVVDLYTADLRQQGITMPLMPMVKFKTRDDPVSIPPHAFAAGGDPSTDCFEAISIALPLQPAYAFTIHKVQGLTLLGDVRIELDTMWPCPHAMYVAMSRVKRASQLSVSGFRADLIRVNDQAVLFDKVVKPVQQVRTDQDQLFAEWARTYRTRRMPQNIGTKDRRAHKQDGSTPLPMSVQSFLSRRNGKNRANITKALDEAAAADAGGFVVPSLVCQATTK